MNISPVAVAPFAMVLYELKMNKSGFTGREIYDVGLGKDLAALQIADYVAQQLGPSWIIRGIPKILATRKPKGRYKAPPEQVSAGRTARAVAGEILGLRTRPYLPGQEMQRHKANRDRIISERDKDIAEWRRKLAAKEVEPAQARAMIGRAVAQKKKARQEFAERAKRFAEATGAK